MPRFALLAAGWLQLQGFQIAERTSGLSWRRGAARVVRVHNAGFSTLGVGTFDRIRVA